MSVWSSLAVAAGLIVPVALVISKVGGHTWELIKNLFM